MTANTLKHYSIEEDKLSFQYIIYYYINCFTFDYRYYYYFISKVFSFLYLPLKDCSWVITFPIVSFDDPSVSESADDYVLTFFAFWIIIVYIGQPIFDLVSKNYSPGLKKRFKKFWAVGFFTVLFHFTSQNLERASVIFKPSLK